MSYCLTLNPLNCCKLYFQFTQLINSKYPFISSSQHHLSLSWYTPHGIADIHKHNAQQNLLFHWHEGCMLTWLGAVLGEWIQRQQDSMLRKWKQYCQYNKFANRWPFTQNRDHYFFFSVSLNHYLMDCCDFDPLMSWLIHSILQWGLLTELEYLITVMLFIFPKHSSILFSSIWLNGKAFTFQTLDHHPIPTLVA